MNTVALLRQVPIFAELEKKLFVFTSRNAQSAAQSFGLPPNPVVELGAQIEF